MIYVIFAFCVVTAVAIHCAFVRPVLNAFRREREENERRKIIERARIAADKLSPNVNGAVHVAQRPAQCCNTRRRQRIAPNARR